MIDIKNYPLALDCPKEKTVIITHEIISQAIDASKKSPRKRIILPFHKSSSANLHRMLNVLQPWSYVQPHRHINPPKAESLIILKGKLVCVEFDQGGEIINVHRLSPDGFSIGIDMEPGIFHTIFAVTEDTVLFEAKPGPYERSSDKERAPWAPAEGSEKAGEYLKKLYEITESC